MVDLLYCLYHYNNSALISTWHTVRFNRSSQTKHTGKNMSNANAIMQIKQICGCEQLTDAQTLHIGFIIQ